MWILFAFGSAFFAGVTAILAKVGVKNVNSNLVTALRTVVVALFAWLMVLIVGSAGQIGDIAPRTLLFLGLSGLATGASWICYFRALSLGDVNRVTPVDKSSTVLTMILSFLILGEPFTWLMAAGMVLILAGTMMMVVKKREPGAVSKKEGGWLLFAILSAVFAALTSILGKIGIEDIESNLGTALRTLVVLVMAWAIVLAEGSQKEIAHIERRSLLFIALSGVATGLSWLCFYRALQLGPASVVVPIDKLSTLVTVAFSYFFLKEKLNALALAGLGLLTTGTLILLL